jgi:hypothetical protein
MPRGLLVTVSIVAEEWPLRGLRAEGRSVMSVMACFCQAPELRTGEQLGYALR